MLYGKTGNLPNKKKRKKKEKIVNIFTCHRVNFLVMTLSICCKS